jgi:hypothetical protein
MVHGGPCISAQAWFVRVDLDKYGMLQGLGGAYESAETPRLSPTFSGEHLQS